MTLVTFVLVVGCKRTTPPDLPTPRARDASFLRGVSLGLFASAEDPEERKRIYFELLEEIRAIGATDVQIVTRWRQPDVASSTIARAPSLTPTDEELEAVLRHAKAMGLRTFLMPIVHLKRRAKGTWRGTLRPTDPSAWWQSYRRFVLHHARVAARCQVDLFSVGSELVSMESKEAEWRALIAEVREVYDGQLTYSANWDHFEPVRIWDAVDVIGITAYQPLSSVVSPGATELDAGWAPFRRRIGMWAASIDRPYVFTEIGYPSAVGGASRPWMHTRRGGAVDLELQHRCYQSMFRTWQDDPRLAGVFVWNWFGFGGPEDPGHTPRHKPAAKVLENWFRGSRTP